MARGDGFTLAADKYIRRVFMPLIGIGGIIYEELQGGVDTALLAVYMALVGLGVTPYFKERVQSGKRGENGPDVPSD